MNPYKPAKTYLCSSSSRSDADLCCEWRDVPGTYLALYAGADGYADTTLPPTVYELYARGQADAFLFLSIGDDDPKLFEPVTFLQPGFYAITGNNSCNNFAGAYPETRIALNPVCYPVKNGAASGTNLNLFQSMLGKASTYAIDNQSAVLADVAAASSTAELKQVVQTHIHKAVGTHHPLAASPDCQVKNGSSATLNLQYAIKVQFELPSITEWAVIFDGLLGTPPTPPLPLYSACILANVLCFLLSDGLDTDKTELLKQYIQVIVFAAGQTDPNAGTCASLHVSTSTILGLLGKTEECGNSTTYAETANRFLKLVNVPVPPGPLPC